MKKLSLLLALALILAMPVFGLAESAEGAGPTQTEVPQAQPETTVQPPFSGRGQGRYRQNRQAPQAGFADENQDSVCDACGQGRGFVDENKDGVCDVCGGQGFVDENKDGVCDTCQQAPRQGRRGGMMQGRGMHGRRGGMMQGKGFRNPQGGMTPGQGRFGQANPGTRPNYMDENQDGVCDHFGTVNRGPGRRN